MNYRMMGRFLALITLCDAIFMIPSFVIALVERDARAVFGFGWTILLTAAASGIVLLICRKARVQFYAREGLISVGIGWIMMSLVGCLPFWISQEIPHFIDAFFETVSGFTTTGASILTNVESLSNSMLYWRSFTHWIGGMGVLVFLLAVVPASGKGSGFTMHLLRAESPGPNVGKLVPRIRQTAMILYVLYIALTVLNIIFLLFGGMPVLEAVCTAFGTAGTGGFGVKNDSMAGYSPYIQNVCTVFMLLFGVNFSCYFMLLLGRIRDVWKDEELRLYLGIVLGSILLIAFNVRGLFSSWEETFQQVAFQVATIVTTTGFATTDFDLWPTFSKFILVMLMFCGACAGSTGGGFKCGRVLLLLKSLSRNIQKTLNPRKIKVVRNNGQVVSEKVLENLHIYLIAYVFLTIASMFLVSLDGESLTTTVTSVIACFNNIGPGLDAVGPIYNYHMFSPLAKLVLIFDMLAGRLEIFPIMILCARSTWKKLT